MLTHWLHVSSDFTDVTLVSDDTFTDEDEDDDEDDDDADEDDDADKNRLRHMCIHVWVPQATTTGKWQTRLRGGKMKYY